ncbi:hypothetical protein SAMN05216266_14716 [Amycolatopsis marina]|uniref:Uncharacterized protein n=1 Tax=Amycolatopsis marina TaxID=490629 RepID=A0A1I1CQ02_9PSEU|nr:hypothetical protein SAMN05216266_14716 [Amycolatopsis marina]
MIVLPAQTRAETVAAVAEYTERAVLAAAPARSVSTVLVDTSAADDRRTRSSFQAARLWGSRLELGVPGAGWGTAVARGLRHAAQIGATEVVLADSAVPADLDAPAGHTQIASALTRLRAQERPGVVCSPLAAPWWQRLLAIHVLRPMCAPTLGVTLLDPQARTLVLSGAAIPAALSPSWGLMRMSWERGHGLGILAAVCQAGLNIGQTLPRIPHPDVFARSMRRDPLDRNEAAPLLRIALRMASIPATAREPAPVVPWVADLGLIRGQLPPPEVFTAMLTQCAQAGHGAATPAGVAAGWPEPLLASWHAARTLRANIPALTEGLWLAYLARLGPWLRFAASTGGYSPPARTSVVAAARQFLLATGTPIAAEQTADDSYGEDLVPPLPGTG